SENLRRRGLAPGAADLSGNQQLLERRRLSGPTRQDSLPTRQGRKAATLPYPQRLRPRGGSHRGGHSRELPEGGRHRENPRGFGAVPRGPYRAAADLIAPPDALAPGAAA